MAYEAIVRVRERLPLFEPVCRVLVEQGRLRMAWVGEVDDDGWIGSRHPEDPLVELTAACPGHDFSRWVSGVFHDESLATVIAAAEAGVQEKSPAAVVEQARLAPIAALQARHSR